MPRVTALRPRRRGVAVELDGRVWRVLHEDVVVRTGLTVGQELTRERLRAVARERRQVQALTVATRALRHRDLSQRRLADRLERAGVREAERVDALAALHRAGFVDDDRVAAGRARVLADRGYGDAAIRFDLEREGIDPDRIETAVAALESEAARAERIASAHGRTPATARRLGRRGFGDDSIEAALGRFAETD